LEGMNRVIPKLRACWAENLAEEKGEACQNSRRVTGRSLRDLGKMGEKLKMAMKMQR